MPQMFTPSFEVSVSSQQSAMSPISIAHRSRSDDSASTSSSSSSGGLTQVKVSHHSLDHLDPDSSLDADQKRDKARKAAKYLKLIAHCQRCNGKCNTLICKNTRLLLNHCAPCLKKEKCPIKGCYQTKKLLCHMIACKFERKQARQAGKQPKYCNICSLAESSKEDDYHLQESTGPDSHGQSSLDMSGFPRPTLLPRRFRSSTMDKNDLTGSDQAFFHSTHNCRSFSVEEESEEMETDDDGMGDAFRSRRVSI